jgi:sulfoxide reductase catalytic subunit YedY
MNKEKLMTDLRAEITPEELYRQRRQFMKAAGVVGMGALLAACAPELQSATTPSPVTDAATDLLDTPNSFEQITNYNNFYEFTTDKEDVAKLAQNFQTTPWQLEVYGLVDKPQVFSMDDILGKFTQEERVYRMRCVEGWSMVIPWQGFTLSQLLDAVEPKAEAQYVRFETILDPEQMPGQKSPVYPWPYQEGLRLDEARHDLTILATGLYGKPMPNQNGAPLRLVVPWKYGFKSIKSIVKIELMDTQPDTLWSAIASREYGFYSNVNPQVDHPRWSQASERRIGETKRRPTLMFNGYEDEVAYLYEGMDLRENY